MDEKATAELGRLMLDRVAAADPAFAAEKALFPVLAAAYFRDRDRALAGSPSGGELGFGFDQAVLLMTPLVLEAARRAGEYLTDEATKRGLRWSGDMVRQALSRRRAEEPVALTDEQWARVHAIVTEVLTGPGKISSGRAELLADAVVGRGHRVAGED